MLFNADFENKVASPWFTFQQNPSIELTTPINQGFSDSKCARIDQSPQTVVAWSNWKQTVYSLTPGGNFELSAQVRMTNITDGHGMSLGVSFFDANGQPVGQSITSPFQTMALSTFEKQTVIGQVPMLARRAEVRLTQHDHGSVWFDDIELI